MKEKIDEATPKNQKKSRSAKKVSMVEEKEENEILLDDDDEEDEEPELDINIESGEAINAEEEIDGEELSDLLDVIEQEEESIDEVIGLIDEEDEDDDSEDMQKLMSSKKTTASVTSDKDDDSDDEEEDVTEIVEETESKPKSRWLITTCRYCGDMYRFRSDQMQPPTCGRAKCVSRYEEISKKKAALIS